MADANVISAAAAAPMPRQPGRHLAEREAVWGKLVEAGLAWQPDSNQRAVAGPLLTLSAPCEWTAEHLKDAALHVLRVEAALREMGWTLGSIASQWVQFAGCRPVWISQTSLRPWEAGGWAARQEFLQEFLNPLLARCGDPLQRPWARWSMPFRRLLAPSKVLNTREGLSLLTKAVESIAPRRAWSPWRSSRHHLEPAGPAAILAQEEASRRGARLIYEWRGKQPASVPLRPWPGVAWVRFHEDEEEAAADYLETRALHACALPLWNVQGNPMAACPRRAPADLLIAAGRGNVPQGAEELKRFTEAIRRMAAAALVEHAGGENPGGWDHFMAALRGAFRIVQVTETGAGRRMCLLEPL